MWSIKVLVVTSVTWDCCLDGDCVVDAVVLLWNWKPPDISQILSLRSCHNVEMMFALSTVATTQETVLGFSEGSDNSCFITQEVCLTLPFVGSRGCWLSRYLEFRESFASVFGVWFSSWCSYAYLPKMKVGLTNHQLVSLSLSVSH
jgi:hypothetical protein